jgi:hypothetical protein
MLSKYISALKFLSVLAAAITLSACGTIRPFGSGDGDWSRSQLMANVQAVVIFDEHYSGIATSNHMRFAGAGPDEMAYRRVIVSIVHNEGGKPILGFKGIRAFIAVVPDGMPFLKKGDFVDVRATTMYDYLQGFAATGEGSAVIRLLCPGEEVATPEKVAKFKACATSLPWHQPWGEDHRYWDGIIASPSGYPFLSKLKDYKEFQYTPFYDADGKPLSTSVPRAPRPSIVTWVPPKNQRPAQK